MTTFRYSIRLAVSAFVTAAFLAPAPLEAGRMPHGGGGGGGRSAGAKRPSTGSRSSINGGAQKAQSRPAPSQGTSAGTRPSQGASAGSARPSQGTSAGAGGARPSQGGGGRGGAGGGGNKVNVDNSRGDVNINVDNSRNVNINNRTNVHRSTAVYARPPYAYGGYRYYCHRPYFYHPYTPYAWGPAYHPWGFFVAALAVTAIVVSVNNQQYHYDEGVFYTKSGDGYTAVEAPVGATVSSVPSGAQTVVVNETTNNYYYGGTYYEKDAKGYTVVAPTAGAIVENLPEGGEEVRIGEQTYVKVGETYYQPIQKDGKNMYEVVQIEPDKA